MEYSNEAGKTTSGLFYWLPGLSQRACHRIELTVFRRVRTAHALSSVGIYFEPSQVTLERILRISKPFWPIFCVDIEQVGTMMAKIREPELIKASHNRAYNS